MMKPEKFSGSRKVDTGVYCQIDIISHTSKSKSLNSLSPHVSWRLGARGVGRMMGGGSGSLQPAGSVFSPYSLGLMKGVTRTEVEIKKDTVSSRTTSGCPDTLASRPRPWQNEQRHQATAKGLTKKAQRDKRCKAGRQKLELTSRPRLQA